VRLYHFIEKVYGIGKGPYKTRVPVSVSVSVWDYSPITSDYYFDFSNRFSLTGKERIWQSFEDAN